MKVVHEVWGTGMRLITGPGWTYGSPAAYRLTRKALKEAVPEASLHTANKALMDVVHDPRIVCGLCERFSQDSDS